MWPHAATTEQQDLQRLEALYGQRFTVQSGESPEILAKPREIKNRGEGASTEGPKVTRTDATPPIDGSFTIC
jgi:hypothetical protein